MMSKVKSNFRKFPMMFRVDQRSAMRAVTGTLMIGAAGMFPETSLAQNVPPPLPSFNPIYQDQPTSPTSTATPPPHSPSSVTQQDLNASVTYSPPPAPQFNPIYSIIVPADSSTAVSDKPPINSDNYSNYVTESNVATVALNNGDPSSLSPTISLPNQLQLVEAPGPLPLFGAAVAFSYSRHLRRRIKNQVG
jgi:hypothetical protein